MCEAFERSLLELIAPELEKPVPPEVRSLADEAVRRAGGRTSEGGGIVAVLFYGSCYRDGVVSDGMVDLYLLADRYASLHHGLLSRLTNRLVPPNVYYVQCSYGDRIVRAKYAVLTLDQFARRMQPDCRNPYFWARFAQPTGIVEVDEAAKDRLQQVLVRAIRTLHGHARCLCGNATNAQDRWVGVLQETYRSELRVEKPERAAQIYRSYQSRFDAIDTILASTPIDPSISRSRRLRRCEGKVLSVLRLVKAAFTFSGGADYLVWKIERHSGTTVELSDWQRRHPILAAGPILWRLWRQRIIR